MLKVLLRTFGLRSSFSAENAAVPFPALAIPLTRCLEALEPRPRLNSLVLPAFLRTSLITWWSLLTAPSVKTKICKEGIT